MWRGRILKMLVSGSGSVENPRSDRKLSDISSRQVSASSDQWTGSTQKPHSTELKNVSSMLSIPFFDGRPLKEMTCKALQAISKKRSLTSIEEDFMKMLKLEADGQFADALQACHGMISIYGAEPEFKAYLEDCYRALHAKVLQSEKVLAELLSTL